MEFTIVCIKKYKVDDEVLFHPGEKYRLVINKNSMAIVMYNNEEGTYFYGSLDEYFESPYSFKKSTRNTNRSSEYGC